MEASMAEITLTVPHTLSPSQAAARLKRLADDLVTRSPYLEGATVSWPTDTEGRIDGGGFSGAFTVGPSMVTAVMRLEGMMAMFRPLVEEKLHELLVQALA
jgi:hypothetical protein